MRWNIRRVGILLAIILFSIGFGFAFDAIVDKIERHRYPKPVSYTDFVAADAAECGVPEAVIWAMVRQESNFVSSKVGESGEIGLMQLTPEQFADICERLLQTTGDSGLLYDPASNLRAGAALLSDLYSRYGNWETVYAAWDTGTEQVDLWLADPTVSNGLGGLKKIPDRETERFVKAVSKSVQKYTDLYDEGE